jgi:hypothetical protein
LKIILSEFKKNFNDLDTDFILETYTRLGYAPSLIYDDNGLFAISDNGFNEVVTGREKIEGSFIVFVEKRQWKKTIRQALKHYMNER